MKPIRHARNVLATVLFATVYSAFSSFSFDQGFPVIAVALIGNSILGMDFKFNLKLSKKTWFFHAFLIPFAISIAFPKNIWMTAFFIGYLAHVIVDLDAQDNWKFAKERAAVGILWIASIVLLMKVFRMTLGDVAHIFGWESFF